MSSHAIGPRTMALPCCPMGRPWQSIGTAVLLLVVAACSEFEVDSESASLERSGPAAALSEASALAAIQSVHERELGQSSEGLAQGPGLADSIRQGLRIRYTSLGTPRNLHGPGFRITADDLGMASDADPRALADAFTTRFASLWHVEPSAFEAATIHVDRRRDSASHLVSVSYQQRWSGIEVAHSMLRVVIDTRSATIVAAVGSFREIPRSTATIPVIDEEMAKAVASDAGGRPPKLVVWSNYRSGDVETTLAWRIPVEEEAGGISETLYVSARDGAVLERSPVKMHALRRSVWDHRGISANTLHSCERWKHQTLAWPGILEADSCLCSGPGCCPACPTSCDGCRADMASCATCACYNPDEPFDNPDCQGSLWRYDETTGCVADGDPAGEGNCGSVASQVWNDAADVYSYWSNSFGRDSWDGSGGYMWGRVGVDYISGGQAAPDDIDGDGVIDLSHASFGTTISSPWLSGHEFGHSLQQGVLASTWLEGDWGFHSTGAGAMEHNSDAQAWHFQGQPIPNECWTSDSHHFTQLETALNSAQINKHIGNCHGWMASQEVFPTGFYWYGLTVAPMNRAKYDQIWYRALTTYVTSDSSYFEWWDAGISAAYDLYGFGSEYDTMVNAAEAIGTWSPVGSLASATQDDRYASTSWPGASKGPCTFFRRNFSPTAIHYRCLLDTGVWSDELPLNDPLVDPAASEPTATFRFESKTYAYVLWRGTYDRIHYRRVDIDTMTVGPPQDMGATHLTAGPVAAAPIFETSAVDRLVVVYHPTDHPTWFFWTYLGNSTRCDMGPASDSDADPSLVPFSYWDRIYFVRPNFDSGSTARHLTYRSYTLGTGCGGWEAPASITDLYAGDSRILPGVVRTDQAVTLAPYNRDPATDRLRMTFVTRSGDTGGSSEVWYATFEESAPGVLTNGLYRPVPLIGVNPYSSSTAGGLAAHPDGYPLLHMWNFRGKLEEWRTFSD